MHFLQELEPAHPSNIMQEQAFCGGGGGVWITEAPFFLLLSKYLKYLMFL